MQRHFDPDRVPSFRLEDASTAIGSAFSVLLIIGASTRSIVEELLVAPTPTSRAIDGDAELERTIVLWQIETERSDVPGLDLALESCPPFAELLADGSELEPGLAYFVPAHCRVWFEGHRARVEPRTASDHHPIDRLLFSMAEGWGSDSTAVVAVPVEKDGESGLRAIREVGGVALQRREAARGVAPTTAAAADELAPGSDGSEPELETSGDRPPPSTRHSSVPASRSGRKLRAFWLPVAALPALHAACEAAVRHAGARGRVRVWMPGCRTGGMAYAVAMLLTEAAAQLSSPARVTLFATDDDEEALTVARAGRYPVLAALGMDLDLRFRYTVDEGEAIRVSEELRESCIFSRHKLTHDTPMTRMDLVVCHRIFDGIAAVRRAQLVEALHGSLRDGGLLLALDHGDWFSGERFEEVEPGLLRALPVSTVRAGTPPSNLRGLQRDDGSVPPSVVASRWPRSRSGEPSTLAAFLHTIGVPLLLCDSRLRLLFASSEAMLAFGMSDADLGRPLETLSAQLPRGADLLPVAWRAVENQATQELSIRAWGKVYLARISAAAPGVSIVFSDVTQLELANREAVAQQHQEAAIARISELALASTEPAALYGEALGVLFDHIPACSGGVIVQLGGGDEKLEVVASRGLGEAPLQLLRQLGEPARLLDVIVERSLLRESMAREPSAAAPASDAPLPPPRHGELLSVPVRSAPGSLIAGVARAITDEGCLVGILGLYGRSPSFDDTQHEHFGQAIANVLGGAIGRQRTRRRLALELEVSSLLAGASSLQAVGQGLQRALGMLPGVERAEIWSEGAPGALRWVRLVPEGESPGAAPPWAEALPTRFDADPLQVAYAGSAREISVAVAGRDVPLAVLHLTGKGLRTPDPELAAGLRRVARMLADFLERSSILERSRRNISELEQVEATLREADQQKDDFLAMLGHELRNPMAAIRNATELLSRIEQPTPQLLRLQSIFDRQTLQTTKLIDGLLDVARVARGKVELQIGPVQVIELVQQVVDDRRQQFRDRQLQLQLPEEPELWVEADRVRLVQILDNLISNALKFTQTSGRIRISVAHAEGRGSVRVEDDGQGIEADMLPQIFEPFRQGRATTAQAQAGLGLGLALVKGLVDLHGFQLRAESPGRGGGASFLIEFPLAEAPESKGPESRVELRVLDLLLVEDNIDIAETLAELLSAAGHRVAIVGSAEDALEHLRQHRPDVVLCDIGLPGMDGLQLAARLRTDPGLAQLKLVAMTGFGDASTQGRVQEAGFDRMLIKPVRLDALRQCLSHVAAASPQSRRPH